MLSSCYGLSGWVLAKEVSIERDTPLRSEIIRCVLPLIHDWRGGLDVQALVGDVISADSRLNMWFAKHARGGGRSMDDTLEILTSLEAVNTTCKAAVADFVNGGDRQRLLDALRLVVENLNQRPKLE